MSDNERLKKTTNHNKSENNFSLFATNMICQETLDNYERDLYLAWIFAGWSTRIR